MVAQIVIVGAAAITLLLIQLAPLLVEKAEGRR